MYYSKITFWEYIYIHGVRNSASKFVSRILLHPLRRPKKYTVATIERVRGYEEYGSSTIRSSKCQKQPQEIDRLY